MSVFQRNMTAGVLHGAFYQLATALAEPFLLLPIFLKGITSSSVLIGLTVSLVHSGRALPQLWASRVLRRFPGCGKHMMLTAVWTRWIIWGVLTFAIWRASPARPWNLAVIVPLLAVYAVAGGVANIPINQVIAETIPPRQRSSFFGLRLIAGGLLAVLAGYIVHTILAVEAIRWPADFGALFLLSFLALGLAYSSLSFMRFPQRAERDKPTNTLPALGGEVRSIMRAYPVLRRLVGVQLLGGGLTMALPFLTLYGKEILGFPASWVGLAIIAQTLGAVLGNLLWIPLGNRHGTRRVALGGLAGALTGVAYLACVGSPLAFLVGFALLGLSTSGIAVGFDGYILELGTEDLRPVLVALQETLLMPVYFMPVLGGLMVTCFGYRSLLVAAGALLAVAVFFGWRLCEPRTRDARCGPCASTSRETAETEGP